MNTTDVFDKIKKRCGDEFLGVFACDRLPAHLPRGRRPLLLICNTDPHYKPGQHWIAICIDERSHGEYFDSYGREAPQIFRNFLNKNCIRWIRNNVRLQSAISSFCGHYCVFYCLLKHFRHDINSIIEYFTDDTALNDAAVHNFVCYYL